MNKLSKVLVIYTGGTIGMKPKDRGLEPEPGLLRSLIQKQPALSDPDIKISGFDFVTSSSKKGVNIGWNLLELDPLLDSANVGPSDWVRFVNLIAQHENDYDGFVFLHGTDTMAYTASALSFMCHGLKKPILFTGSQIPLVQLRNDALDNLLGAIGIAGHYPIAEVCIYFHHQLFRANRTVKHDAASLDAFCSPNFPPLARVGVDIELQQGVSIPPSALKFEVRTALNPHVACIRLFPGISAKLLSNLLQPPLQGLVLETYGSGNAPDKQSDLILALKEATSRGVLIVGVTQCEKGAVRASYAAGKALTDAGVVLGGDMTREAALTKMMVLLANHPLKEATGLMNVSLRGELTDCG